MCKERNDFIELRNCVAMMHFVLTMRTKDFEFFHVYLRIRNYIAT